MSLKQLLGIKIFQLKGSSEKARKPNGQSSRLDNQNPQVKFFGSFQLNKSSWSDFEKLNFGFDPALK